jgi:hypothetical protein
MNAFSPKATSDYIESRVYREIPIYSNATTPPPARTVHDIARRSFHAFWRAEREYLPLKSG